MDKTAKKIAIQYLQHEFRKILNDVRGKGFWDKIDKSIKNLESRQGESSFISLLAAIAEAWKAKRVFRILSNAKYQWSLEEMAYSKIVFTGMSPNVDKYLLVKYKRNPLEIFEAWKEDKEMREAISKSGIEPHAERDHFPVFLVEKESKFFIFDGMRRSLLNLLNGEKTIKAWVGKETNKKGKPLISIDRCLFLANIYEDSDSKDDKLKDSIVRIGKEVISQYENGQDILLDRIAGWSHNSEIKKIFRKMLK